MVSPRHQGHKRIYLPEEVIEITVIAELRRKGFSLQKIRRVLRFLQREMGRRLAEVLSNDSRPPPADRRKIIYLEDQQDRIIDLLKNARQPMFLVCVSDQVKRLDEIPKKMTRSEPCSPEASPAQPFSASWLYPGTKSKIPFATSILKGIPLEVYLSSQRRFLFSFLYF